MKYFLDLFSGIGGFALGAEWAGLHFDKHYFSEVDDYAIKVYSRRFPGAVGLGDIKQINGDSLPKGDWIIAGGFPCQDISVAGKGAGLAGARSGLWYEYARIIGELRPRYAIMENVGALTHRGLDSVLGSLAEIGYDAEWQDIRASDVGAPHRRERIWIVAYPNAMREPGSPKSRQQLERAAQSKGGCTVGMETGSDVAYPASREPREPSKREGREDIGGGSTDIGRDASEGRKALANPDSEHGPRRPEPQQPTSAGGKSRDQPARGGAAGNVADADEARPQGQRESGGIGEAQPRARRDYECTGQNWSTEPDVGRVAHGIPARVDRLKCLGNSIVPQIAELIFREIKP